MALCVNCSDVFAWGCADAEGAAHSEVSDLYDHWLKDPDWGAAIWCMKKRNQMPQRPVERAIRSAWVWDLDALDLQPNTLDQRVKAAAASRSQCGGTPAEQKL